MAEIFPGAGPKFSINAVGLYVLGDASDGVVSTFSLQLVDPLSTFVGSLVVQARSRLPVARTGSISIGGVTVTGDDVAFKTISYWDPALAIYTTAAITAATIITIPASGWEIGLNVTALTAGTLNAYLQPLQGSAA